MKRLLLLLISVFALVSASWADQITREQALAKAQQFLSQKGLSRSLKVAETQMSRARARGKSTPDYYYVFNAGQNQGFVIISGDDHAEEVLGYSDRGSFDIENNPSNMAAWLEGYAAQIKSLQENRVTLTKKTITRSSFASVSPFVEVHWDQNSPYNKYCMLDLPKTNKHIQAPTGCVATAMAQAMSVYKYPSATTAEIPSYKKNFGNDGYASYEAVPANTAIDWANLDVLNYNGSETDAQKEAIANLMSYCGRSVEMLYNGIGSSASVSDVPYALKTYFGYGVQAAYKKRSWSSDEDWNLMIYNEVAAHRPVIYGGQTEDSGGSGHAFIIDGYDGGEDAFHINWGWGQLSSSPDGYFKLSALKPAVQGTGGSNKGYNFSQEAVIGIDSNSSGVTEAVNATIVGVLFDAAGTSIDTSIKNKTTTIEFSKSGGKVSLALFFQFQNHLSNIYSFEFGMGLIKNGSLVGDVISAGNVDDLDNSTTWTTGWTTYYFGSGIENGIYEIKAYSKKKGSSDKWRLCEDADKNIIYVKVTDNKIIFSKTSFTGTTEEVSDAQRNEVKKKFESLKDKITGKQEKVSANAAEIASLQTASASASEAVSGLDDKLADIKTLIDGSKLLTESLKTYFTNKLADLKTKNNQLKEALYKIKTKLETIKAANDNLKQQLDNALKIVNEQIAGVSNITTTKALDEANAKATDLSGQIDVYDADKVETDIKTVKADLTSIDVNTLSEELNALDPDIAKAIADAEAAAEAEEAAKKLAEAKEKCNKAVEDLTKVIDDQTKKYNTIVASLEELNKKLKEIDDYIKDFQAKAKAISDMIAEMKSPSADRTRATADEIKKYEDALANLNAQIEKLSEAKAKVEQEIKNIEGLKDNTQKIIDDATKVRDQVKNGYADATSTEAVETMITQVTAETTSLNSDGAESINAVIADINTQIASVEAEIAAINTDVADISKKTEDLNKEVTAGIGNISIDENDIQGRYDLNGRPVDANYKGAMIIRMTNGKTITIIKR